MNISIELRVEEKGKKAPNYDIRSDLQGEVTLADLFKHLKSSLIAISDMALKEEQANGFEKNPIVIVDGSAKKRIENVSPMGKIEFHSKAVTSIALMEAYDAILKRSPKGRTGTYANSNYVTLNGKLIAANRGELQDWINSKVTIADKDVFRFVNVMPYARYLERMGITTAGGSRRSRKSKDKQLRSGATVLAENGTYFLSYRAMLRLFSKNYKIRFELLPGSTLGIDGVIIKRPDRKGNFRRTYSKDGKNARKGVNSYLYPTIKIEIIPGGSV